MAQVEHVGPAVCGGVEARSRDENGSAGERAPRKAAAAGVTRGATVGLRAVTEAQAGEDGATSRGRRRPEGQLDPPRHPCFLFGVDDVLAALVEAGDAGGPLFAHPLFAALKALHTEFGLDIDLYLFLEGTVAGRRRSLREVPQQVAHDLASSPWLRLGPHGLDHAHPPYRQTEAEQRATFLALYAEIDRLVGPQRRSRCLRLHCFSESFALADLWRQHGVEALLLTDRPAVSYHLPLAERAELEARGVVRHAGMLALRTHERMEDLADAALTDADLAARLDRHLARHGRLVLCTHETELGRAQVRDAAARCLRHARARELLADVGNVR